jgi:hypothetical protein
MSVSIKHRAPAFRVLLAAAALVAAMVVPATPAMAQPPEITRATFGIARTDDGTSVTYRFEVDIVASGAWPGGPGLGDVAVFIDGQPLTLGGVEPRGGFDGSTWHFGADGQFFGTPTLGEYSVTVTDSEGSGSFIAGTLGGIPEGGPDFRPVGCSTPTFAWDAFKSDYLGTPYDPLEFELNLDIAGEGFHVFPVGGTETAVTFADPRWHPRPPDPLEPGTYGTRLISIHPVAANFHFMHELGGEFTVGHNECLTQQSQNGLWGEAQPIAGAIDVAVDDGGEVYVSAQAESMIHVFDSDGQYLRSIAADEPHGIAVDKDRIYNAAVTLGKVQVLDKAGTVLHEWSSWDEAGTPMSFEQPVHLCHR